MRIDWYTKAVLTVIAVALVVIAGEDYVLPAQGQGQRTLDVWVKGGSVRVDGIVDVKGEVEIKGPVTVTEILLPVTYLK